MLQYGVLLCPKPCLELNTMLTNNSNSLCQAAVSPDQDGTSEYLHLTCFCSGVESHGEMVSQCRKQACRMMYSELFKCLSTVLPDKAYVKRSAHTLGVTTHECMCAIAIHPCRSKLRVCTQHPQFPAQDYRLVSDGSLLYLAASLATASASRPITYVLAKLGGKVCLVRFPSYYSFL